MVLVAGFAPALATFSTSCLCSWTTRAKWMEPPDSAALSRLAYKESPRAAARRHRNGLPAETRQQLKPPAYATVCLGAAAFAYSSVAGEGWSQSPVLPWAQRAYETCLSAGSTAMLSMKMDPPPGVAPGKQLACRASASLTMLLGLRKWSTRDDLHVQGCLVLSQVGLLFPVNHASPFAQKLRRTGPRLSTISRGAGSQKHAQTHS
jgi:hypothetical protein